MSDWEKVPAFTGTIHQGCLCCPPVEANAPMEMGIAVGFGSAMVTKGSEVIYSEPTSQADYEVFDLAHFEEMAKEDPDHDWRVQLVAPLRDREYQRQGDGKWVLISSGPGFV